MDDSISTSHLDFLLIGELAQRTGCNPKTIRFYEREGLIVPVRHGRFRIYSCRNEQRLRAILDMRRMGLAIAQIRTVLNKSNTIEEAMQSSHFADLLNKHLKDLAERQTVIERQILETSSALDKLKIKDVG
jgi:DNA-binding transcriptional MerR regulator